MGIWRRLKEKRIELVGGGLLALVLAAYFGGFVRDVPVCVEMRQGAALVVTKSVDSGPLAAVVSQIPREVPVYTILADGSRIEGVTLSFDGTVMSGTLPIAVHRRWWRWEVELGQMRLEADSPGPQAPQSPQTTCQSPPVRAVVVTGLDSSRSSPGLVRRFVRGWFGL